MKVVLAVIVCALAIVSVVNGLGAVPDNHSPEHIKNVLGLINHVAERNATHALGLFKPGPQDHCCLIWDNVKCAEVVYKCVNKCEGGISDCVACLGPLWETCCCCVQQLMEKKDRVTCPTCCTA
eukprot:TRINITY_DN22_c0_g1_i1.p1 TRINITY_DN22_c0_g1~~TRINITY_DN22_c0_g1_i1.p1  ORF type:complete len:142 (-),score=23.53 TRINITY_DN22_c0_g1_i1:48-419(-)